MNKKLIINVAPTATLGNDGPVPEGSTATVTFSGQADPSADDLAALVYSYDFGSGWSAGAHFRLTSGDPETPVLGGVYDANSDLYRAIYGDVNSQRRPMFHQLDLRGEKKWAFEDWALTAYLEILNAYNAQNVEGTTYSFDYTKQESATGLPIFPNLGIRGEL